MQYYGYDYDYATTARAAVLSPWCTATNPFGDVTLVADNRSVQFRQFGCSKVGCPGVVLAVLYWVLSSFLRSLYSNFSSAAHSAVRN